MRFRILGPLEVAERELTRPLGGVKQRAVLAILLVHRGEVLSGERLIAELWGEHAPATAAKVLQAYISRLRKAVGADVLRTRGRGYVLSPAAGEVDLDVFERLAADGRAALAGGDAASAAARLREALGLWRGPPLADFTYEPFAQGEIARLEQARMAALEDRIDADLALGRHHQLVPELEQLTREHPLRERLCAQRMLALYRAGRQAEALQAYRDSRQVLVDQLGIEPGRELRELHQAIAGQDPRLDLQGQTLVLALREARRSAAFVGRQRELSELAGALCDAAGGQGRLLLLTGEPGIGKSRLAEELARHARAQGAQVLVGRCWEAGGAPAFWPWVQSLRSYLRANDRDELGGELGLGAAEIAAILPELRELIPGLRQPTAPESEGARFRLFAATAEFLRRASDKRPLVLILDDLHAADTPSLLLVQFLAREIGSMHVLLVAAMRDVDPIPAEPLTVMLAEVAREPATRRLSLTGLAEDEVAEYIRLTAAEIASPELTSALYGETEGNPLFVSETVRLLVLEGLPPQACGTPRLAIPPTIGAVISRRLAHLSPGCNQMLVQASVLGREFALDALERVSTEPEAQFLQCVDEATAARVVADVPGVRGHLRFSHVLVRDTLYDRLGAARRARLHRRAGEILEALYARDPGPHLAELAHHFLEASAAGTPGKAVEYAQGAAQRAVSALAYEEAVRLYQMALQAHSREEPPDAMIGCELLLALGDAQTRAGDTPAAKQAFLLAAELARRAGTSGGVMARAALGYGGRFLFNVSRDDPRLRPLLEEALADLGDADSELRAMLLARLAGGPLRDEPSRERRAFLSEQAVDMARRLGDPALLGYVLDARFMAIWAPDNTGVRLAIAAEMVQLSESTGDLERLFQGHAHRMWTLLELGDLAAVPAEIGITSRISDDLRQPAQLWMVAAGRALCALLEGRFEQAGELTEEAFRLGERTIPWNAAVTRDFQLFALRREQGRLDELEEAVRDAVQAYPTYPVWRCVLADLYAELGRHDQARAEFERFAADDFTGLPFNEEWLLGLTLLADVCAALGDVPRAGRLYELLLPYRELHAVGQVEISLGAVARALGKLAATAGRCEQATRHFEAAIRLNEQSGARPWTAHARHDYARMLAAHGDRQQAHQQLAQALATYRELGMDRWADNTLARGDSTLHSFHDPFHRSGTWRSN